MLAAIAGKSPRIVVGERPAAILLRMSEDERREAAQREAEAGDAVAKEAPGQPTDDDSVDDEPMETPFDHPLFLPAVLLGLSLWFFWDGFVVPMEGHLAFNRWGFAVLAVATAWFGYRGLREMRQSRTDDQDDQPAG
jgi:hypothetical protein